MNTIFNAPINRIYGTMFKAKKVCFTSSRGCGKMVENGGAGMPKQKNEQICAVLMQMNLSLGEDLTIEAYLHEEDQQPYEVYEITDGERKFVLKKAKEYEAEVYCTFFQDAPSYVPKIYGKTQYGDAIYILMEHIAGENLQKCTREKLKLTLDALIAMQEEYWGSDLTQKGYPFEASRKKRKNRGEYLNDSVLQEAYIRFLEVYDKTPKTLCNDDFLPFQVIVSEDRAVMIDWEVGGILPYPTSLARLIAHGQENPESLFYLSQTDREFAIQYYYDHLISEKGIAYEEFRQTLDYFLFYEYCEWVYVGNRYEATDGDYFQHYFPLAKQAAEKLIRRGSNEQSVHCALRGLFAGQLHQSD